MKRKVLIGLGLGLVATVMVAGVTRARRNHKARQAALPLPA